MSRSIFKYHPKIGYTFIPGIKASVPHPDGAYLVQVNNQGFRSNRDFAREKAGKFRALVFGDSFTAGDGVTNEVRYTERLEQNFPGIEVYNFGLPGTGTDQQYLTYQEFPVQHDLIIIAVLIENIRRIASRFRLYSSDKGQLLAYAKPYYVMQNGGLTLKNVPVPRLPFPAREIPEEEQLYIHPDGRLPLLQQFLNPGVVPHLARWATRYPLIQEYDDSKHPAWLLMKTILVQWIRQSITPVVIMPIPYYPFVEGTSDPTNYQKRFRELAAETNCILHDPLPDFLKYPAEERRKFRFQIDFHLSPEGHTLLANSLAKTIGRLP